MLAVMKKELKDYFLSPVGYVVIGIFLIAFSLLFIITIMVNGTVDLGILYYNVSFVDLVIIVPILTMRMFSEERKTGTEQLLLTSPTRMFSIIMGKFFAAVLVIVITLVISLMYFVILKTVGTPNIATTLTQILGLILISMAAISLGIFASSLTENQIIAGVITGVILLLSTIMDSVSPKFAEYNLNNKYIKFAEGTISIENIISFLLVTFVFIGFTMIVMQRRKLVK